MRVLLVTATFHPAIGGAETYAYEVARALIEAGHSMSIITDGARAVPVSGDPSGVTVHRLTEYQRSLYDESKIPWEQMAFGLMPECERIVTDVMPDIVVTNSLDTAMLGRVIGSQRRIPWAAAFHEQTPETEPLGVGRLELVYGRLRPDLVLAGSEFYADRARRWGDPSSVKLIYHGVDTDAFAPGVDGSIVRQRYGIQPDHMLIVCAGRLKARKGMRELINAISAVVQAYDSTRLLIVGSVNSASRAYADELHSMVARMNLSERVLFDEHVPFEAMPQVYAAADIVAQPSLAEGLGLSVLEAMAAGKPVVTTDIPGVREITTAPGVAVVVPPGDVPSLVEAILLLIQRPEARRSVGVSARTHVVEWFSRSRMAHETEAALLELVRTQGRGCS